jgi:pre-mRNA-splicing helicase BRR2
VDELDEDADEDEEGAEDTDMAAHEVRTGGDVDAGEEDHDSGLKATEIDAYWLQREITKYFAGIDADAAQKLSEEVFAKLEDGSNQDCENALVMLLDFDKFDLIKVLLKNRVKIVWCTRLARAQVCLAHYEAATVEIMLPCSCL